MRSTSYQRRTFRLFFRADACARIIVYARVNDRDTLRKQGAATDPYTIFAKMLAAGTPPTDFQTLLATSETFLFPADDNET